MAEEDTKKPEAETPPPPPEPVVEAPPAAEKKALVPLPEDKPEESKALVVVEAVEEKTEEGSVNRDAVLAKVETEKKIALVTAWEDNEKAKVENKTHKKLSGVASWENIKKAALEAELKKMEEKLEKSKAEYAEKIKNQIALLHKEAQEKRAFIEAKRGEELLKAEELAAKHRAKGTAPKKPFLGCI